jgi:uncharacterized protein (UPF0332 family)
MHLDLFSKALEAAEAARDEFDERRYDSAVNRAYYAMFNAARAFLASVGVDADQSSHGAVLQLFGLHAIKTGKLSQDFGRSFNRAQEARSVADYDQTSMAEPDARTHLEAAERLVDEIGKLLPSLPANKRRGESAKEKAEADIKRALADAFCNAVEARGETPPPGLVEQLVLYGSRESLTRMFAELDEMNDLNSFLTQRFPDLRL